MCRLVAYLGHEALIEDIIVKPSNSLVMQSLHARETELPTNGDGFGLGWYVPDISEEPALFTSVHPAWNDRNLLHLASKIKSPCFLSHVRAASAGGVSQFNCHPFLHNEWMFMHNGGIHDFPKVKRHIRHLLDDEIYDLVKGQTDSEHAFGLFLQLAKGKDLTKADTIAALLKETIEQIEKLVLAYGDEGASNMNFVITDGQRLVATRYNSIHENQARTLHYSVGDAFLPKDNKYHMLPPKEKPNCVLICSEKLNDYEGEWHDIPGNHIIMVDSLSSGEKHIDFLSLL